MHRLACQLLCLFYCGSTSIIKVFSQIRKVYASCSLLRSRLNSYQWDFYVASRDLTKEVLSRQVGEVILHHGRDRNHGLGVVLRHEQECSVHGLSPKLIARVGMWFRIRSGDGLHDVFTVSQIRFGRTAHTTNCSQPL